MLLPPKSLQHVSNHSLSQLFECNTHQSGYHGERYRQVFELAVRQVSLYPGTHWRNTHLAFAQLCEK